jgi:hypothetical protein
MTLPYTFALCTATKLVTPSMLHELARPLEINAQDCAKAWSSSTRPLPPPAIVVAEDKGRLPIYCRPIVFVDKEGDPGTLAVHYWDSIGNGPAARVYVDHTSGFREGAWSVVESAAHEVLEALVDATVDQWVPHPTLRLGDTEVDVALENCDPCQDTYNVFHAGVMWPVANFVTPAWFDAKLTDPFERARFIAAGGRFDFAGRLSGPGEMGPDGYEVVRAKNKDGDWVYWNEWPMMHKATTPARAAALEHPWSRTKHRLAGCPRRMRPAVPENA